MKSSKRWIIAAALAVALVLMVAAVATAGMRAKDVAAAARRGRSEASAGVKSLAALDATAAASQFQAADDSFALAAAAMGPDWMAGPIESIPWAGRQYSAARSLTRIGSDGSRAGLELARLLSVAATETASTKKGDRLAGKLSAGRPHLVSALTLLADAAEQADALSAEGLVAPLADAVTSVKDALSTLDPFVRRIPAFLELESYLLSEDRRILIVSQDGAELRPTGGWAGSFGIVDTGPEGVKLDSYKDVFVLPSPTPTEPMPPGARQSSRFNFRNANWWLDYPTSAQRMLKFWDEYGQEPVDGIIVIDTVAVADLLEVVGPVTVPDFKETFTHKNLLDRLLTLTQVERGGQPDRKNVLVGLAQQLEKRLQEASPAELAKVARSLGKSADEKHVQMYFTDPQAQAAAESLGWSGKVAPPKDATDLVAISNAMNRPGKVNIAMRKTILYEVVLRPDGAADTRLRLGFANTGPFDYPYVPSIFRDWLRVYRLPGTVFGPNPDGSKTIELDEFGFPAEAREFTLVRGKRRSETFTARVPDALRSDSEGTTGAEGRYRLYFVRQADLQDIPTTITVQAPPGESISSASAQFVASGTGVPVKVEGDKATLVTPLRGDLSVDVSVSQQ